MKRNYALLLSLTAFFFVSGQNSYFDQLAEVNKEWISNSACFEDYQKEPTRELGDRTAISAHLAEVQKYLLSNTPADLTPIQKSRRHELLCGLTPYYTNDWFPVNTVLAYRNPIFIDEGDRFCAVGYLMKTSGREDLAREIAEQQNYAYVGEIVHPELASWASWAGFTQEELAWIQPGYPPQPFIGSLQSGVDGSVYAFADDFGGGLIVAGAFSNVNDTVPSPYLAHWISGIAGYSWLPIPNNLPSPVHALHAYNNGYVVGGDFIYHGDTTSVYFLSPQGNIQPMGVLGGEVRRFIEYKDSLYAVGRFNANPPGGNQYGMAVWDGVDWQVRMGGCNGRVEAVIEYMGDLVLGGSFTENLSHLVKFDGQQFSAMGSTPIKAPIYDFEFAGGTLFAAGDLFNALNPLDTFGLAAYLGGEWQTLPIAVNFDTSVTTRFNELQAFQNTLILGGQFKYFPFVGFFSENLLRFDPMNWFFEGIAMTSGPVYSMHNSFNNSVFFGGDFVLANTITVNNVANSDFNLFNLDEGAIPQIKVFPNPTVDQLRVDWPDGIEQANIEILDMQGKVVFEADVHRGESISVSALPAGNYLLHFITLEATNIAKFNKA